MSARRYLKGGLLLSGGSVLSAGCSFARNIIIARLISVEDFGIAATFAMTMSLIEMASNLALDRMLVQAPDGGAPRMLATAHAFQVFRGVVSAVILFLLAAPVAALFDIPGVVWAFQLIALVPLIKSFTHLDAACQQRDMRFGASVWLDTAPQVVVTVFAAPLALWLGDYRVMLVVVLGQVILMTLVSHWVASRPYRWAWDRQIIGRMLRFGWPLLINGFLMFAIFQGDKAIIGAAFTMEELGWYAAAFGLVLVPAMVASRVLQTFLLPMLSRLQDNMPAYQQRFIQSAQLCMAVGFVFGISAIIAVDDFLVFFYGYRYSEGASVIGVLALMQAVRIARIGQSLGAMGLGDTKNPLYANAVRSIAIPLALIAVATGQGVWAVAATGLVGECLAAVCSQLLLRRRFKLPAKPLLPLAVIAGAVLLVIGWADSTFGLGGEPPSVLAIILGCAAGAAAMLCSVVCAPELRELLRRYGREIRPGLQSSGTVSVEELA
ncbi:MAG: oligosaccharide flippase family protein [Phycisphaerales bacterium JB050]